MKLKIILLIIFILVFFIGAFLIIKINIPLTFKEAQINYDAYNYIIDLQKKLKLEPIDCAIKYLYFKTDYHDKVPEKIKAKIKIINDYNVLVIIYDPSCEDDSEYQTIDRIFLIKKNNTWEPFKHDWSHKGRGKFGWTTENTI